MAEPAAASGGAGANDGQQSALGGRPQRQSDPVSSSLAGTNGAPAGSSGDPVASSSSQKAESVGSAQESVAGEPAGKNRAELGESAASPGSSVCDGVSSRLPFDDSGYRDTELSRSRPASARRASQNGDFKVRLPSTEQYYHPHAILAQTAVKFNNRPLKSLDSIISFCPEGLWWLWVALTGGHAVQMRETVPWPPGFRDRLPERPTHRIVAQQGAVNAAAAARTEDGPLVYCVGQTGTLKIYSLESGAQVRRAFRRRGICVVP